MLNEKEKVRLTDIVRQSLLSAVQKGNYQPDDPGEGNLQKACGCFVTYKTGGQLRGCLGCFVSENPLYKTVAEYAKYSCTEDPRFAHNRIREEELSDVTLDISVLSPLQECTEPEKIELGRHGIYIKSGFSSGCFLPQVATETGWSIEEFWGNCCMHKAGLSYDAWKEGQAELFTFTAEVIEAAYAD